MLIDHDLWLSELKPDYYYFEAQTKKIRYSYLKWKCELLRKVMTAHAYNHSNIITTTIIIIITATKIGELLWCSNNNMATTKQIFVEIFFII